MALEVPFFPNLTERISQIAHDSRRSVRRRRKAKQRIWREIDATVSSLNSSTSLLPKQERDTAASIASIRGDEVATLVIPTDRGLHRSLREQGTLWPQIDQILNELRGK